MEYLGAEEVEEIHRRVLQEFGGGAGIRDSGALLSSVEQPQQTMFGQDLYPTVGAKAAALAFCLTQNHPFLDASKRTAYASMTVFLRKNGYRIQALEGEPQDIFLKLADGKLSQQTFFVWVQDHIIALA